MNMKDEPDDRFDHRSVDRKWQQKWIEDKTYKTGTDNLTDTSKKEYVLDMFPYPSGVGLHVGHPLGYIATDIVSRYFRARGKQVLHPMGYDAFGLPAENYAIKTGMHPMESTRRSIGRFRGQMQMIGLSYDWDRELDSSSPEYYRWTQWLFLKLYEMDLAYRANAPVNWCPKDQTVLANEQVKDGRCERCDNIVEQKELEQWFFRMTNYAEEFLTGLEKIDWPEPIKLMQRNWVGKSEGAIVRFPLLNSEQGIEVFTTRIDTIFSGTFVILAPEHPLIDALSSHIGNWQEVQRYRERARQKTDLERGREDREATGVELQGLQVTNPATGEVLPVWIADFVLAKYGTGAVFADAHDARDFALAKKYGVPLKTSIKPVGRDDAAIRRLEEVFTEDGVLYNSQQFDTLTSAEARPAITSWLAKKGLARASVTYKLRDWLVSRQRYWGAPIPMVICEDHGYQPVPQDELPVKLPTDVDFRPTGESPLARSREFHAGVTCPQCGKSARREVDTMDTFVDSSWYFLRYIDPNDSRRAFAPDYANRWLPVDWYVGGAEHAVLHLLYSRFCTKALADAGYLNFREPFARLRNQGLIRGEDNRKMSKRWGNVINPDDVVREYGADALRCFEMFMGPFEDSKPWSTSGLIGIRRWLERVWRLKGRVSSGKTSPAAHRTLHRSIRAVTQMIESFHFNTAVSQLMITTNAFEKSSIISRDDWRAFLQLLAPFAPHVTNELWSRSDYTDPLDTAPWPQADLALLKADLVTLPIQINGKTRASITVKPDADEEELLTLAKKHERIAPYIRNKEIVRELVVPGRIISIVIR